MISQVISITRLLVVVVEFEGLTKLSVASAASRLQLLSDLADDIYNKPAGSVG